tara:strand:- start:6207 stop:7331 length:1125 start_codon:yes stop_codon:yes gene_type:complete
MKFELFLPTKIIFGKKSLTRVQDVVNKFGVNRLLIVTGRHSAQKNGNLDKLHGILKNYSRYVFDNVLPNPNLQTVIEGGQYARLKKVELVIGLGGGSAMDAAKSIALMACQNFSGALAFEKKDNDFKQGLPYIAVPTTSGSGGEVTKWSSIWGHKKQVKASLSHNLMYPDYCVVDPVLTLNMPKRITATTGLDALCHAIEAYWSKNSNPVSDGLSQIAACLIINNLQLATKYPGVLKYREALSKASLMAGMAFSQTKTTACHAISYPLTAYYKIPHGLACALSLPHVYEFNRGKIKDKAACIASWFKCKSSEQGNQKISSFIKSLNLPVSLREMNIKINNFEDILNSSLKSQQIQNNPRRMAKSDLLRILNNLQ